MYVILALRVGDDHRVPDAAQGDGQQILLALHFR